MDLCGLVTQNDSIAWMDALDESQNTNGIQTLKNCVRKILNHIFDRLYELVSMNLHPTKKKLELIFLWKL